jgi:hypothetical protein
VRKINDNDGMENNDKVLMVKMFKKLLKKLKSFDDLKC